MRSKRECGGGIVCGGVGEPPAERGVPNSTGVNTDTTQSSLTRRDHGGRVSGKEPEPKQHAHYSITVRDPGTGLVKQRLTVSEQKRLEVEAATFVFRGWANWAHRRCQGIAMSRQFKEGGGGSSGGPVGGGGTAGVSPVLGGFLGGLGGSSPTRRR